MEGWKMSKKKVGLAKPEAKKQRGENRASDIAKRTRKSVGTAKAPAATGDGDAAKKPAGEDEAADRSIEGRLARARQAGKYLIIIARVENGRVYADWNTHGFPKGDVPVVATLISEQLAEIGNG
jgi:hypothetical protein